MIDLNNKPNFTDKFLTKLLENGFDFMKEKELKIYILYLLLKNGQFINNDRDIDYHDASLELKINETKVRNLIYKVELKYRNNHNVMMIHVIGSQLLEHCFILWFFHFFRLSFIMPKFGLIK